jgi:hypothetical protein
VQNGVSLGDYMKQPKLNEIKLDAVGTRKLRAKAKKSNKVRVAINIDSNILETSSKLKKKLET